MANCYVKAYFDWIEQTAALQDAERGRLFVGVLEYARTGTLPELSGRESILFPVFKAQIDRDNKISTVRAEAGKNGVKANLSKTKQNLANTSKTPNKEKEKEKENNKDEEEPPKSPFDGALNEAFQDWIAYKRERREAYKPTGLKSLIAQIRNCAEKYGDQAVVKVIRDSMSAGYKGIVFDRLDKLTEKKKPMIVSSASSQSDDEKIAQMKRMLEKMGGNAE